MNVKLAKTEIIHFLGIGGIGMSGLAIIMNGLGFHVQGSDLIESKNTERLKKLNIKVLIGHKKKNISNSTIVVISSAIKANNPEYKEAVLRKLPIFKRGEMLGNIVSLMKNVVVSGSHGKTTTTSLISSIFSMAKLDPTIINGGVLNSYKNSARLGKSEWCILESDESDGSFLNIPFIYSIVTNVDKEHLDFYKSIRNLKSKFIEFINKTPSYGKCFICSDDKINKSIIKKIENKNFFTYGIEKKSNFFIKNISQTKNFSKFDVQISLPNKKTKYIKNIVIPMIGIHNIRNSTAALAVSYIIGVTDNIILKGLKTFNGVQRRFNYLFKLQGTDFVDDYAHHPTEISSVLEGVKKVYTEEKIYCIFQPHRVSRLKSLKDEFSKSFSNADYLILCPIYKAGENIKLNFKYEQFAKQIIKNSKVKLIMINNENELKKYVTQNIYGKNIVIGMGAGSISQWMRNLPNKL